MSNTEGKVKSRIKVLYSHKFSGYYTAHMQCISKWLPKILFSTLETHKILTEFQEEKGIWDLCVEIFQVHDNCESLLKWCYHLRTQTSQGLFPNPRFLLSQMSSSRADQVLVLPKLTSKVTFLEGLSLPPWL